MKQLLNDGWRFALLENSSTLEDALAADFAPVDLPHDWLIWHATDLYRSGDGWYRRNLHVPCAGDGQTRLLRFDGVYMDCDVLVNGRIVCTHRYGYTAFDADLTPALHDGDNELMVHVRYTSPNSRWYSGAGIYRDVTYCQLPARHIVPDGVYVTTRQEGDSWRVHIATELAGPAGAAPLTHRLVDEDGTTVAEISLPAAADAVQAEMCIRHPLLWSCDHPHCYTLITILGPQEEQHTVGFRTITFTTDEGLFLNGQPLKLHGVCLHHDLGALGAAFHEKAARRQLRCMRNMGVNALRTAHNPPARQVMELCDRMGILVVSEIFDMWERPKTTWDYARFFPDCWAEDVSAWVRRDRNHPSLLMWSIGNEILDTHVDERGRELTRLLADEVARHDPHKNGAVTIGLNYLPWENAQRCVDLIKFAGYNYAEKYYAPHHAKYPDWYIYGSETASLLSSRGVYHFPADTPILSDADLQCSSLGNSLTSWGTRDLRRCIVEDLTTPYSMGQFLWAGIDYIGEPTPYHTRSCYFGYAYTACFPKDLYHYVRAMWQDAPVLHIGVHWNWNPGQLIDVNVMTNAPQAELFLGGESLGRKAVSRSVPEQSLPRWQVPFAPGTLTARSYDEQGQLIAEVSRRTNGSSAALALQAEDAQLLADGHDMTFLTVTALDQQGLPVDNAVDRIHVEISGPGVLLGLDNGDSTDLDAYKGNSRRLFSGKLLIMLGATDQPGDITVQVTAPGLQGAQLVIPALPAQPLPGRSRIQRIQAEVHQEPIHARKLELIPLGPTRLNPGRREVSFRWRLLPEAAMPQDISWQAANAMGIESACASLSVTGDAVTLRALGDGLVYLRGMVNNGYGHPRLISQQEICIEGLGQPNLNPYGFITAGLYDLHSGEITPGNDKGVAFARDGRSMCGFSQVDFGPVGTEEIELPIFALDSKPYTLDMYLGNPDEGAPLFAAFPYQKPSRWNVYQPETYRLPRRITGLQTVCFVMQEKIHLRGFRCTPLARAWLPLSALEADAIYGDSFRPAPEGVMNIGNNVFLVYEGMDFGDAREAVLTLRGSTPLPENPVTIRIQGETQECDHVVNFTGSSCEQRFRLPLCPGPCRVSFVFLPGSRFDFYGFQFEHA